MSRVVEEEVVIVGAGLVGCLLGVYLRQHDFRVSIYESRPDPRTIADSGRSINLVITSRGIAALTGVSDKLAARIMSITVPVFGRVLHQQKSGGTEEVYQPYGPDESYCNFSVSRWELNVELMSAAEEAGCKIHFCHALNHADIPNSDLFFYLQNPNNNLLYQKRVHCTHMFGADGGGSRVRQSLKGFLGDAGYDSCQPLGHGYKELQMPVQPAHKMTRESLHIWPRGSHFLMALPNRDGSNTMTLYMSDKGKGVSFANIKTEAEIRAYFEEFYPDAVPLMPDFVKQYQENPTGFLGNVFCAPWVFEDKVALIGDAAHGITPFFGQGCNSGFEDVFILDRILKKRTKSDMKAVFAEYYSLRKDNGDAIAKLALDNFDEMMSRTGKPSFLLQKEIEIELSKRFPDKYVTRYALVTHSLVPYETCRQMGFIQEKILNDLSRGITHVSQTNMDLAAKLIQELLVPFLKKHNIKQSDFNYVSKYYPKPKSKL